MAIDSNAINALTREKFIPLLVDNIFTSNIMANKFLANADILDGGRKIITPLEVAKAANYNGFYSDYDTLTPATNTPIHKAEWDWVQAYAGLYISSREIALNSGDSQVLSVLKAKLRNAEKSLKDLFGDALWNTGDVSGGSPDYKNHTALAYVDNSGTAGDGDGHICTSSVGHATGGITSTSGGAADYWMCQSGTWTNASGNLTIADLYADADSTGTAQIIRDMTDMYGKCTVDADQPDLIVTTQALADVYESALMAKKRFVNVDSAVGGFTGLQFKNAVVVVDSHVPAGHMYFLNSNYLDYKVHGSRNFMFEGFKTRETVDGQIARIFWMGQFVCTNPRMIGVLQGTFSAAES